MTKEIIFSVTKKDFDLTWYSGTGGGGQHRNKHQNCCRIKHRATGVTKTGSSQRTRPQNQKEAFLSLTNDPKFKSWLKLETAKASMDKEAVDRQIEKEVNNSMKEENLKIEAIPRYECDECEYTSITEFKKCPKCGSKEK